MPSASRSDRFSSRRLLDIQLFVDDHPHLGQRKRLQNVVAGAGLHGLDGGFDAAECGHHHDRKRRILALDGLQKFQTVHAGKFQVGQNQVDGIFAQQFETGLGVSGGKRGESVVAEIQLEQAAHLGFVFDDQNGRHRASLPRFAESHEITR